MRDDDEIDIVSKRQDAKIGDMKGRTISAILGNIGDEELYFVMKEGDGYRMKHYQDCCESVVLEDIVGDLSWLINSPILLAEERSSSSKDEHGIPGKDNDCESYTWTFYEFVTMKGAVTLRWYGVSNGYYSEKVDFEWIQI